MSGKDDGQLRDGERYRQAERLLKSIDIPSQPKITLEINKEIQRPNPDMKVLAGLLGSDPALTARLLKLANSPLFGIRKRVDSIKQALFSLGLQVVQNLVMASSLRDALGGRAGSKAVFETFWEHSMLVARTAELIARECPVCPGFVTINHAYLAGLFHDCAVPLLLKKSPAYAEIAEIALGSGHSTEAVEEKHCGTNHSIVGEFMAKSWKLPESVSWAIGQHHSPEISPGSEIAAAKLWAILRLSEYISEWYGENMQYSSAEADLDWAMSHESVMDELHFNTNAILDLKKMALQTLQPVR